MVCNARSVTPPWNEENRTTLRATTTFSITVALVDTFNITLKLKIKTGKNNMHPELSILLEKTKSDWLRRRLEIDEAGMRHPTREIEDNTIPLYQMAPAPTHGFLNSILP